ncbi:MAG: twin-arginine translocase TatA/TatE family subunit [Anaerolineales bacterium]|nr:twin-arginine translocase TatA/TatE family subunit [Anaerolineales bacterium]
MPFRMGPIELAIILVIVLVLFGVGRIGRIGGELGKGIRAFRLGIKDEEADSSTDNDSTIESEDSDTGDL